MPTSIRIEKKMQETRNWKDGIYQAVIKDLKDRVVEKESPYNQVGDKLISFEFVILKEGEFKGARVWRDYVKPYITAPKKGKDGSILYQIIKAAFPKMSDLDIYNIPDPNRLINEQVILNIKAVEGNDGNIYPKIFGYAPVDEKLPYNPVEETRVSDEDIDIKAEELDF